MTNFEKYKDEILKIATESKSSPAKKDGVIIACYGLPCRECDFEADVLGGCEKKRYTWLYEDDREQELTCSSCKHADKDEDEYPCSQCSRDRTDMFELKKTRQSEFLKLFPNAMITNGVLEALPCKLEGMEFEERNCNSHDQCVDCCKEYWLKKVE